MEPKAFQKLLCNRQQSGMPVLAPGHYDLYRMAGIVHYEAGLHDRGSLMPVFSSATSRKSPFSGGMSGTSFSDLTGAAAIVTNNALFRACELQPALIYTFPDLIRVQADDRKGPEDLAVPEVRVFIQLFGKAGGLLSDPGKRPRRR